MTRRFARWALRQVAGSKILPSKTIGTAGEQFFACRALEEGLHVAQPLGDNLPYDLLVDSGQEIHRLQIKSTTTEEQGQSHKYGFALNHGKDSSSYQADTVDFFGLVVLPLRTIYSPSRLSGRPHQGLRLSGEPGFGWIARTLPRKLGAAVKLF